MNDDWRLEVDFDDPRRTGALTERLEAGELEHDLSGAFHDRVIVSHEGSTVFLYAGSREQVERRCSQARRARGVDRGGAPPGREKRAP